MIGVVPHLADEAALAPLYQRDVPLHLVGVGDVSTAAARLSRHQRDRDVAVIPGGSEHGGVSLKYNSLWQHEFTKKSRK